MTIGEAFFDEVGIFADDFDVERGGRVDIFESARRLPDFRESGKGRIIPQNRSDGFIAAEMAQGECNCS